MIDKNCNHSYSRGLNEPRPRLCVHCKEPETCNACIGTSTIHMCCPVCTSRNFGKSHTCSEHRQYQYTSPGICGHGYDDISICRKCTPDEVIPPRILTKWEKRWMERAESVAQYSKDKNTKTGAIIVDDDNTELVMGYNGFPRGADDVTDQRRYERPDKYFWTEHAERNAIFKAARIGLSTKGANMYCTYFPCADCSRAIIQAGIKRLYTEKPDLNHHKWGESWINGIIMLKECGVEIVWTNEGENNEG